MQCLVQVCLTCVSSKLSLIEHRGADLELPCDASEKEPGLIALPENQSWLTRCGYLNVKPRVFRNIQVDVTVQVSNLQSRSWLHLQQYTVIIARCWVPGKCWVMHNLRGLCLPCSTLRIEKKGDCLYTRVTPSRLWMWELKLTHPKTGFDSALKLPRLAFLGHKIWKLSMVQHLQPEQALEEQKYWVELLYNPRTGEWFASCLDWPGSNQSYVSCLGCSRSVAIYMVERPYPTCSACIGVCDSFVQYTCLNLSVLLAQHALELRGIQYSSVL